jgi:hypothetical protein
MIQRTCPVQVLTRQFKRVPFDPDHFREQLATAGHEVLQDMSTALGMRETVIQRHIALIQQLEDDSMCKSLVSHHSAEIPAFWQGETLLDLL